MVPYYAKLSIRILKIIQLIEARIKPASARIMVFFHSAVEFSVALQIAIWYAPIMIKIIAIVPAIPIKKSVAPKITTGISSV
jgi:hypothetical protein